MVKLADIARDLNVSIATVSNALSGKGRMNEETRRLIIRRAKHLGYNAAEGGKRAQRKIVGILTEQLGLLFSDAIVNGICEEAFENNIQTCIYNLGLHSRKMTAIPKIDELAAVVKSTLDSIDSNLAGLVYVSAYPRDITGVLEKVDCPVVLSYCTTTEPYCTVNYDDKQGAYSAVEYLLHNGRRKIAMISGPIDSIAMSYRTIGYQRALINNGLIFDPKWIRIGDWRMESGYSVMQDLLRLPEIPDAVFSQNDFMAIGAIHAIQDAGLRIPEDIAIIGFDNTLLTNYSRPALSSVDPHLRNIGRQSLKQIIRMINKDSKVEERLFLPCSIVHRDTTPERSETGGEPA